MKTRNKQNIAYIFQKEEVDHNHWSGSNLRDDVGISVDREHISGTKRRR